MPTAFQDLSAACRRHKLRLRLCCDRDHVKLMDGGPAVQSALSVLEIRDGDDLLVKVAMKEHTIETAAKVALTCLGEAGKL